VRAGLLPLLVEPGTIPGIDLWRSAVTEPTAGSLVTLGERLYAPGVLPELAASAQPTAAKWARVAAESPEAAADTLVWGLDRVGDAERLRAGAGHNLKAALMLVVDQLENLFGISGQKPFRRTLRALVTSGRVWLLATMRSDRYTDLQLDPDLLATKRDGATYDLPPPGPAEISDIVKGPARSAGLAFAERDRSSLARVLVEAVPNADALPLLQMTLSQLFERREGETLGFSAYDAIGGIEGAIAAHANAIFTAAPASVQRELDPLLRALVRDVSRRADRTIRFTARNAERKLFETTVARKDLVKTLVDGRLLVSDGEGIRVAHEALLRRWDRARQAVERIADAELRKARLWTIGVAVVAVLFFALGTYAVFENRIAVAERQEAVQQLDRANQELANRLWSDLGIADSGILTSRPLNALWSLARAPGDVRRPFVLMAWANKEGEMQRLIRSSQRIPRALGLEWPSAKEIDEVFNAFASWQLTDRVTARENLVGIIPAVAPNLSEAQAQEVLSLLLKEMSETRDSGVLLDLTNAIKSLGLTLSEAQLRQALVPLLEGISRQTNDFSLWNLGQAVSALPARLSETQVQTALTPILEKITMQTGVTGVWLVQAIKAMSSRLSDEQAKSALTPLLEKIGQVTKPSDLMTLTEAIGALPTTLTPLHRRDEV
jgi:hypothetical protein